MRHVSQSPGGWENKEILVTVKAYPNPSRSYGETVCVAGISGNQRIRLYPLQFRDLSPDRAFTKYEIIRTRVKKHSNDNRPESYRPDQSSIQRVRVISAGNGWEERKQTVLPTASRSMCEIQRLQREKGKSLGMFKPKEVLDFRIVKDSIFIQVHIYVPRL